MAASQPANPLPPFAVSLGDPAGVGPEIVAKSWMMRDARSLPPFFANLLPEDRLPLMAHVTEAAEAAVRSIFLERRRLLTAGLIQTISIANYNGSSGSSASTASAPPTWLLQTSHALPWKVPPSVSLTV